MNLTELKNNFLQELSASYSQSEIEELYFIFCQKKIGFSKMECRTSQNFLLSENLQKEFNNALLLLKAGIPYQQIVEEAQFYGELFFVNKHVLIPRPETEELVEFAIQKIKGLRFEDSKIKHQSSNINYKILDIGTGSGIIPLILKRHFPEAEIFGMDISDKALEVAKLNSKQLNLKVEWLQQDYLSTSLTEEFDIIISNPPYIGIDEEFEIENSVKNFEPTIALFSPTDDSLLFYKKIAEDCKSNLKKDGLLFLEINQKLGEETLALFKDFSHSELIKDLSGNDRIIFGVK